MMKLKSVVVLDVSVFGWCGKRIASRRVGGGDRDVGSRLECTYGGDCSEGLSGGKNGIFCGRAEGEEARRGLG